MQTLGNKIKELRQERNLSQMQLAKLLNVSDAIICKWESDTNEPKASYIFLLAKFFDVTSDYLLGLEDMIYINSSSTNITNEYGINNIINNCGNNFSNNAETVDTSPFLTQDECQLLSDFRKLSKDRQAAIKLLLK